MGARARRIDRRLLPMLVSLRQGRISELVADAMSNQISRRALSATVGESGAKGACEVKKAVRCQWNTPPIPLLSL